MYWVLNPKSLGLVARQNELIELSLTYKFSGFDVDILEFHQQAQQRGLEYATRFIASAPLRLGSFELPVRWQDDVANFKVDLSNLPAILETATAIGTNTAYTTVLPYSDNLPYHENFEQARQRLAEIAEVLQSHGIRLGVNFLAASNHREGHKESFITKPEEVTTLVKTVASSSVGLCLDTWNWHVGGGTLDQIKELDAGQIVQARIADLPNDADLATVTDEQRLLPDKTGVVPNAGFVRWLQEQGYEGPISPFCHPSQFSTRNKFALVESVYRSIKRVLQPESDEPAPAPESETDSEEASQTVASA